MKLFIEGANSDFVHMFLRMLKFEFLFPVAQFL